MGDSNADSLDVAESDLLLGESENKCSGKNSEKTRQLRQSLDSSHSRGRSMQHRIMEVHVDLLAECSRCHGARVKHKP